MHMLFHGMQNIYFIRGVMIHMKKNPLLTVLALVLACAMLFAACSSGNTQSSTPAEESSTTASEPSEAEPTAEPTAEPEEDSAPEESVPEEGGAEESTPEESTGEYATVEEFLADPEVKEMIDEMVEGMATDGLTFKVYAEGNTLVYEATFDEQLDPEAEETTQMVEALQDAYESLGSVFTNIADVLNEELGITDAAVDLRFKNADGSELFTMTF